MSSRTRAVAVVLLLLLLLGGWWLAQYDAPLAKASTGAVEATAPPPSSSPPRRRRSLPARAFAFDEDLPEPSRLAAVAPVGEDAGASAPADSPDTRSEEAKAEALREFLRENAAAAEKYVDRYCAEAKRLGSIKALEEAPKTRNQDAAMFLAGRADWEEGRIGALHLPSSLVERMGSPPRNWRTFTEADYAGLDFGWMRELLQFDHWSLTAAGPLKDGAFTNFLEAPLPYFVTLQQWVKLRLVKGRQEGDLAQASLEVRHLADLCASTGSFVGEMIRAAMYGIERGFIEDQGLAAPQGQPPVPSADDVQLLRRTGHIGTRMLYPGVPRAVKEKALACNPVMRCSTLIEGMSVTASMRDLVPGAAADLDWLAAQSPCDPALAEFVRKSPAAPASTLESMFKDTEGIEEHLRELLDGGL